MNLRIVLKEKVEGLGERGRICELKRGYFVNFLGPQGKAYLLGTPEAKKILREINLKKEQKTEEKKELEKLAQAIAGQSIEVIAKAKKDGCLYAPVSAAQVKRAIEEQLKIKLDKIALDRKIEHLGEHRVIIKTEGEKEAEIILLVVEK